MSLNKLLCATLFSLALPVNAYGKPASVEDSYDVFIKGGRYYGYFDIAGFGAGYSLLVRNVALRLGISAIYGHDITGRSYTSGDVEIDARGIGVSLSSYFGDTFFTKVESGFLQVNTNYNGPLFHEGQFKKYIGTLGLGIGNTFLIKDSLQISIQWLELVYPLMSRSVDRTIPYEFAVSRPGKEVREITTGPAWSLFVSEIGYRF